MERKYIGEIKAGESVFLQGWVYELRILSKMAFILLRDSSGMIQCIVKDNELLKKISELTLESVVEICGKVKKANVKAEFARDDLEIEVTDWTLISKADKLPIHLNEKTTTTSFLISNAKYPSL